MTTLPCWSKTLVGDRSVKRASLILGKSNNNLWQIVFNFGHQSLYVHLRFTPCTRGNFCYRGFLFNIRPYLSLFFAFRDLSTFNMRALKHSTIGCCLFMGCEATRFSSNSVKYCLIEKKTTQCAKLSPLSSKIVFPEVISVKQHLLFF